MAVEVPVSPALGGGRPGWGFVVCCCWGGSGSGAAAAAALQLLLCCWAVAVNRLMGSVVEGTANEWDKASSWAPTQAPSQVSSQVSRQASRQVSSRALSRAPTQVSICYGVQWGGAPTADGNMDNARGPPTESSHQRSDVDSAASRTMCSYPSTEHVTESYSDKR